MKSTDYVFLVWLAAKLIIDAIGFVYIIWRLK